MQAEVARQTVLRQEQQLAAMGTISFFKNKTLHAEKFLLISRFAGEATQSRNSFTI